MYFVKSLKISSIFNFFIMDKKYFYNQYNLQIFLLAQFLVIVDIRLCVSVFQCEWYVSNKAIFWIVVY